MALSVVVVACSIYANLAWAVTNPADFRYFPPSEAGVNANHNRALGHEYFNIARALAAGIYLVLLARFRRGFQYADLSWLLMPAINLMLAGFLWFGYIRSWRIAVACSAACARSSARSPRRRNDAMNTDQDLLERFITLRDEQAFADLLDRHGKTVWSVCRRLLGVHDAEDAFQTVLLLFFRKAASIRRPQALASWLYGVAYRTALRLRRTAARRDRFERLHVTPPRDERPWGDASFHEFRRLIVHEVQRLKETERLAFMLCCLQGMSRPAAARQLGLSETLVGRRVATARRQLRARLARRGILRAG